MAHWHKLLCKYNKWFNYAGPWCRMTNLLQSKSTLDYEGFHCGFTCLFLIERSLFSSRIESWQAKLEQISKIHKQKSLNLYSDLCNRFKIIFHRDNMHGVPMKHFSIFLKICDSDITLKKCFLSTISKQWQYWQYLYTKS